MKKNNIKKSSLNLSSEIVALEKAYQEFRGKIKKITKDRDKKINAIIKRIEHREIEKIRKELKSV
jgi:hypothetical protein